MDGDLPCDVVVDYYTGLRCHDVVPAVSYRAFVFTIYNPSSTDIPRRWASECEFITWQLEKGEEGTLHLQGYFVLKPNPKNKNGRTFSWVKANIDPHMWFQERRGTHAQAVAYANKEDTRQSGPWTIGEWSDTTGPSRGGLKGGDQNKSKILAIKRKIDEGVDEEDLYEEHFSDMLRYAKGFDRYRMIKRGNARDWYTKCLVFWGPPGTGKSQRAHDYARRKYGKDVYYLNLNHKKDSIYWDGYTGQACVVIEEFFGGMPINYFNKLHDKFPFSVENKGGAVPFRAELIIYTSNEAPIMWYGKGETPGAPSKIPMEVLNAFQRRLTGENGCVIEMKDTYVPTYTPSDFKEVFLDEENKLIAHELEAIDNPIDLTADENDDDVNWDQHSQGSAQLYNDEVGDDDAGVDDEAYADRPTLSLDRDEDDDVNDKTPPISQKRMFPPPLNLHSTSRLQLHRDEEPPGRFKKPRQAGTTVQTKLAIIKE